MSRKSLIGLLSILLAASFLSSALALDMGNDRKGKYTYRKVYKACSERGAVQSARPPLSPDTNTPPRQVVAARIILSSPPRAPGYPTSGRAQSRQSR